MKTEPKLAGCERVALALAAGTASAALLCSVLLIFDQAGHDAGAELQARAAAPIVVAQATSTGASSPSLRR